MKKFTSWLAILSFLAPIFPKPVYPALTEADQALLLHTKNYATNGGAENGKTGWTASGTSAVAGDLALTTTAAGKYEGNAAFTWTPHNADNYLTNTSVTITSGGGLSKVNCAAIVWTKTTDTTHAIEAYDGTNVLASVTVPSSTSFVPMTLNWVCPDSGTVAIRVNAGSTTAISFDSLKWGDARGINISQVAQAYKAGSLAWAVTTNCSWTETAGSFSNFSNDNDCDDNARTATGIVSDGTSGLRPALTLTNAPAGDYMVIADGAFGETALGATTSIDNVWRLYDGTNEYGARILQQINASSATLATYTPNLVFNFSLSAPLTATLDLQTECFGTNCKAGVDVTLSSLKFTVYYFPPSTQLGYRIDTTPASWSGYHDNTCSWARTNAAYGDPTADASCALVERTNRNFGTVTSYLSGSDKLPGIVFTPPRIGRYGIEACFSGFGPTSSTVVVNYELSDTSSNVIAENYAQTVNTSATSWPICLKGIYDVSSIASKTIRLRTKSDSGANTISAPSTNTSTIEWRIFELDAAMPTPYLVQGVVASQNSTGVTTINNYVSKSANYTATSTDETITFTADATLTLPPAANVPGKKYHVLSSGSGTDVTIDPNASETVCGQTTIVLAGAEAVTIQSNGTNWIGLNNSCSATRGTIIRCVSSSTINSQIGSDGGASDWISSAGNISANACTITMQTGVYSAAPYCVAVNQGAATLFYWNSATTSTQFFMANHTDAGANVSDHTDHIICFGPR